VRTFQEWAAHCRYVEGTLAYEHALNGYQAGLAAAPTPEVEPVAVVDMYHGVGGVVWGNDGIPVEGTKLYTHPAPSDELVKAARELLTACNEALPFMPHNLDGLMANLDAQLTKHQPAEPKAPPTQAELYDMESAINRHLNGGGR
jgi:hypothetical protein